jgi:hypothetical protein
VSGLRLMSVLLLALGGCIPFSSFQSARMVPKDSLQGTCSLSWSNLRTDEDVPAGWTFFDVRLRSGITSRSDAALGMTMMVQSKTGGVAGALGGDIRASLWKDRIAVTLPGSVVIGDVGFYSFQLQPGIVATAPISDRWDVTVAARRHLFVRGLDIKPIWSGDLGLGVPFPGRDWTLRPEVGVLFVDSGDSPYFQVGIGLEFPAK